MYCYVCVVSIVWNIYVRTIGVCIFTCVSQCSLRFSTLQCKNVVCSGAVWSDWVTKAKSSFTSNASETIVSVHQLTWWYVSTYERLVRTCVLKGSIICIYMSYVHAPCPGGYNHQIVHGAMY